MLSSGCDLVVGCAACIVTGLAVFSAVAERIPARDPEAQFRKKEADFFMGRKENLQV